MLLMLRLNESFNECYWLDINIQYLKHLGSGVKLVKNSFITDILTRSMFTTLGIKASVNAVLVVSTCSQI